MTIAWLTWLASPQAALGYGTTSHVGSPPRWARWSSSPAPSSSKSSIQTKVGFPGASSGHTQPSPPPTPGPQTLLGHKRQGCRAPCRQVNNPCPGACIQGSCVGWGWGNHRPPAHRDTEVPLRPGCQVHMGTHCRGWSKAGLSHMASTPRPEKAGYG